MSPIVRITPHTVELGSGLKVHRALPSRHQRMVGAWCFLDHAGPVDFPPGQGMHVGAHPHIGLQTFTWLIEGDIVHRDSLGNEQVIRPGQVNLMTAGHGIAHTEDSIADGQRLHAAQLWIALPPDQQDRAPAFEHHAEMPRWDEGDARLTLLAGTHAGRTAPTTVHSPLLGLDLASDKGATLDIALNPAFEHGLMPLTGHADIEGETFQADEFAYMAPGRDTLRLRLGAGARVLLLGGEPFARPVLMWWNFVGFSKEAIAQAQAQWQSGDARFGVVDGGRAPRLAAPPMPSLRD